MFQMSTFFGQGHAHQRESSEDVSGEPQLTVSEQVLKACGDNLDLPEVRALQSETFDLIFVPMAMNECPLALASTFNNASIIVLSPMSVPSGVAQYYGNPSPASFVPNFFVGYTDTMTFFERTVNLIVESIWRTFITVMVPYSEEIYREKLGENMPGYDELLKNTSLILSNSHFSIAPTRPFLPDIVEVGGMHCRPAVPLPKDLEDFVSSSGEEGFILFSMGSVLKAETMPEEKRKILVNVFSKLKQKVLWKWDTKEMDDLPQNVKLSKWLPQQDVLGHPKIKAFITHGGFGSTTEAVYHGVPIIGLPIFADQTLNMKTAASSGYGIALDFDSLTEEGLFESINKIVTNVKYQEEASKISNIFRDQPDRPLDRAIYWSEYVIRHKGAPHLRSSARELNFFQYHSIDVIAFITGILLAIIYIFFKIMKLLYSKLISTFTPKIQSKRKYN